MVTQEFLNTTFEAIRPQLKSYLLRMTASIEDTEDIVQDTYLKAHEKLDSFRGDASLKTWLFTIATNLAKNKLKSQKRWPEQVTDICKEAASSNNAFFQDLNKLQKLDSKLTFFRNFR